MALSAVTTENKEELRGEVQRMDHQGTAGKQRAEPVCPLHKETGPKVMCGSSEARSSGNFKPAEELTTARLLLKDSGQRVV